MSNINSNLLNNQNNNNNNNLNQDPPQNDNENHLIGNILAEDDNSDSDPDEAPAGSKMGSGGVGTSQQNTLTAGASNSGFGAGAKLGPFTGTGGGAYTGLAGGAYGGAFNNSGIPERVGSTSGSEMGLYFGHESPQGKKLGFGLQPGGAGQGTNLTGTPFSSLFAQPTDQYDSEPLMRRPSGIDGNVFAAPSGLSQTSQDMKSMPMHSFLTSLQQTAQNNSSNLASQNPGQQQNLQNSNNLEGSVNQGSGLTTSIGFGAQPSNIGGSNPFIPSVGGDQNPNQQDIYRTKEYYEYYHNLKPRDPRLPLPIYMPSLDSNDKKGSSGSQGQATTTTEDIEKKLSQLNIRDENQASLGNTSAQAALLQQNAIFQKLQTGSQSQQPSMDTLLQLQVAQNNFPMQYQQLMAAANQQSLYQNATGPLQNSQFTQGQTFAGQGYASTQPGSSSAFQSQTPTSSMQIQQNQTNGNNAASQNLTIPNVQQQQTGNNNGGGRWKKKGGRGGNNSAAASTTQTSSGASVQTISEPPPMPKPGQTKVSQIVQIAGSAAAQSQILPQNNSALGVNSFIQSALPGNQVQRMQPNLQSMSGNPQNFIGQFAQNQLMNGLGQNQIDQNKLGMQSNLIGLGYNQAQALGGATGGQTTGIVNNQIQANTLFNQQIGNSLNPLALMQQIGAAAVNNPQNAANMMQNLNSNGSNNFGAQQNALQNQAQSLFNQGSFANTNSQGLQQNQLSMLNQLQGNLAGNQGQLGANGTPFDAMVNSYMQQMMNRMMLGNTQNQNPSVNQFFSHGSGLNNTTGMNGQNLINNPLASMLGNMPNQGNFGSLGQNQSINGFTSNQTGNLQNMSTFGQQFFGGQSAVGSQQSANQNVFQTAAQSTQNQQSDTHQSNTSTSQHQHHQSNSGHNTNYQRKGNNHTTVNNAQSHASNLNQNTLPSGNNGSRREGGGGGGGHNNNARGGRGGNQNASTAASQYQGNNNSTAPQNNRGGHHHAHRGDQSSYNQNRGGISNNHPMDYQSSGNQGGNYQMFQQQNQSMQRQPINNFSQGNNTSIGDHQQISPAIQQAAKSEFLEDLRNKIQNGKKIEIRDIKDHVVECSMDQYGSRFIQQKYDVTTEEEKELIFSEILPEANSLMNDVFGNYVVQKLFEYGTEVQTATLAEQLLGNVLKLTKSMYGCRVVQKALEVISLDQQKLLVQELKDSVLDCIYDQNGNHVIQKCIEMMPSESVDFIVQAVCEQSKIVIELCLHTYGCRVIQRILENCEEQQTKLIIDFILADISILTKDQFGNYVIQHILEQGKNQEDKYRIVKSIKGKVIEMSNHKFASNVVEKCLQHGNDKDKKDIIDEFLESNYELAEEITNMNGGNQLNGALYTMMKDRYGNYVIQKCIEVSKGKQRDILIKKITACANVLRKQANYSRHVYNFIEKFCPEGGDPNNIVPDSVANNQMSMQMGNNTQDSGVGQNTRHGNYQPRGGRGGNQGANNSNHGYVDMNSGNNTSYQYNQQQNQMGGGHHYVQKKQSTTGNQNQTSHHQGKRK